MWRWPVVISFYHQRMCAARGQAGTHAHTHTHTQNTKHTQPARLVNQRGFLRPRLGSQPELGKCTHRKAKQVHEARARTRVYLRALLRHEDGEQACLAAAGRVGHQCANNQQSARRLRTCVRWSSIGQICYTRLVAYS